MHLKGCIQVLTPILANNQPILGKVNIMNKYYECGICEHLHPWNFDGDCRDDANRLRSDEIPNDAEVLSWNDRLVADQAYFDQVATA